MSKGGRLYLKTVNEKAAVQGLHEGVNLIDYPVPEDRYEGQLRELAAILRGDKAYPVELYDHDLVVHKVSLQACNLDV